MTRPTQPPRFASWLLDLFVPRDQAPPILGDLLEEFSAVASRSGIVPARRWYWRQSAKTVPHLLNAQFRLAPWRNLAAVLTGLLLLSQANVLVMAGVWAHYPGDWPEPLRLLWLACFPMAPLVIATMLVGCVVAGVSERREMVVTIMLSLTIATLRVTALLIHWRAGGPRFWGPFLAGAPGPPIGAAVYPIAILIGGLIARKAVRASGQRTVE